MHFSRKVSQLAAGIPQVTLREQLAPPLPGAGGSGDGGGLGGGGGVGAGGGVGSLLHVQSAAGQLGGLACERGNVPGGLGEGGVSRLAGWAAADDCGAQNVHCSSRRTTHR